MTPQQQFDLKRKKFFDTLKWLGGKVKMYTKFEKLIISLIY